MSTAPAGLSVAASNSRDGSSAQRTPTWLMEFRSDIYSQIGEDGVLAKILELLPEKNKWCVEFGAWDGRHLSTTRHLIESSGYHAVLIEGSKEKFQELKQNHPVDRVIPLNRFVGFSENDNLDTILADTPIPADFDFLSIDIDGNDYHVWRAVNVYQPKVVAIEFNPTIPTEVKYVQDADPRISRGCSLAALCELATDKGYELVCVLPWTAFFVRRELFPAFGINDNRPATLRTDLSDITYIFSGFDGAVLLSGAQRLPWHEIAIKSSSLQVLPRYLRIFPPHYSGFARRLFRLWKKIWCSGS